MATQYSLTNAFTAITEESGTIQNIGYESVELVSTSNAVAGEGIILLPGEKKAFKGAIKARSLGATNTVNVVDFKEGVGGGDDVMTGASASADGKSGLVPTPTAGNENRFLRGDGTWAVPTDEDTQYQPATTLTDGLMSAADKTFVEGEKEQYRQPSTTYTAGQIAYHSALPTGWYLECTTAGTTGSGDLAISSPSIGGTVSDGTVTWSILSLQASVKKALSTATDLDLIKSTTIAYAAEGITLNTPTTNGRGRFNVMVMQDYNYVTQIAAQADIQAESQQIYFRSFASTWNNWQQLESIVAKALNTNGYIKYASGLVLQWGMDTVDSTKTVTLNVIIPNANYLVFVQCANGAGDYTQYSIRTKNSNNFVVNANVSGGRNIQWFAIGY